MQEATNNMLLWITAAAGGGGVLGVLGQWITAKYRKKTAVEEAQITHHVNLTGTVFDASERLRQELQDMVEKLTARVDKLEKELAAARQELLEKEIKYVKLQQDFDQLKIEFVELEHEFTEYKALHE